MSQEPATNASIAWYAMLKFIVEHGLESSPRGKPIYEILGTRFHMNMNNPVVAVPERKLSYTFMAAEALWILSGSDKVEDILPYNEHLSKFSDDGRTFFGAYGPPVKEQLGYVAHKLVDDPDSRQAVISIWRPNPKDSKDVPCTLSLQFLIRDNEMHTIATMRSSDVWLGLPYDIFTFTAITVQITRFINYIRGGGAMLRLGGLMLNAGSSHVYLDDLKKIQDSNVLSVEVARKITTYDYAIPPDLVIPCRCNDCRTQLIFDRHDYFKESLLACRDKKEDQNTIWRIRPPKG